MTLIGTNFDQLNLLEMYMKIQSLEDNLVRIHINGAQSMNFHI